MPLIGLKKTKSTSLSFGVETADGNYLKIDVLDYVYPENDDYWEGNWLKINISLKAGPFEAAYPGQIKNYNLLDFKKGLKRELQYANQTNVNAFLDSLKNWIEIKIVSQGNYNYLAQCIACDRPPGGNKLKFTLKLKRDHIETLISEIKMITDAFPVRGHA